MTDSTDSVLAANITKADLRRLYGILEDEERYYDMTVGKSRSGYVTVRLIIHRDDAPYFNSILGPMEATKQ